MGVSGKTNGGSEARNRRSQRLNLEYLQMSGSHPVAVNDHARREQRLKEIMNELKSMTDWKKPQNMEASVTRRMEILTQIARLGKQQKETARRIISTGRRSPKGDARYDERAQRVAELVLTAILNLRGGAASHAGNGDILGKSPAVC